MQQGSIRWQRPEVQAGAPCAAEKNHSRITVLKSTRVYLPHSAGLPRLSSRRTFLKKRAAFTWDEAVFCSH